LREGEVRESMETPVDAYIKALQNSATLEIHKSLVAVDANFGSAIAKTTKGHPLQDEIEKALANDEIESGLGTLKMIESKILTDSIGSQKRFALGDFLALEYKDRANFSAFVEQFKGFIRKVG